MKRDISFVPNAWEKSGLVYAYSYRFEETPVFLQRRDCIENSKNGGAVYGFDNISLLTEEKYGPETTVTACCAFEDLGAPLIVLADSMTRDPRGVCRYGDYLEVVLWKNGVNVWRMWMEDGTVTWKQLLGVEFPVSEGARHTLSVTAHAESLEITADDRKLWLHIPELYPAFHVGINACEGINRFYSFRLSQSE